MVQQWTCDVDWSGQQRTCDVMMACVELQVTIMIVMMMVMMLMVMVMMLMACVDIHTYIHTYMHIYLDCSRHCEAQSEDHQTTSSYHGSILVITITQSPLRCSYHCMELSIH